MCSDFEQLTTAYTFLLCQRFNVKRIHIKWYLGYQTTALNYIYTYSTISHI